MLSMYFYLTQKYYNQIVMILDFGHSHNRFSGYDKFRKFWIFLENQFSRRLCSPDVVVVIKKETKQRALLTAKRTSHSKESAKAQVELEDLGKLLSEVGDNFFIDLKKKKKLSEE